MFDRVNSALYTALIDAGIEIPNPQYDVHASLTQAKGWTSSA